MPKRQKHYDRKIIKKCKKCKKNLPKFNEHHFLCDPCWKDDQYKKGNFTVYNKWRASK